MADSSNSNNSNDASTSFYHKYNSEEDFKNAINLSSIHNDDDDNNNNDNNNHNNNNHNNNHDNNNHDNNNHDNNNNNHDNNNNKSETNQEFIEYFIKFFEHYNTRANFLLNDKVYIDIPKNGFDDYDSQKQFLMDINKKYEEKNYLEGKYVVIDKLRQGIIDNLIYSTKGIDKGFEYLNLIKFEEQKYSSRGKKDKAKLNNENIVK